MGEIVPVPPPTEIQRASPRYVFYENLAECPFGYEGYRLQYNTIQYNTIQYNTILRYNALRLAMFSTKIWQNVPLVTRVIGYNTIQYNTMHFNTIHTIQYNTI